jgi:hypothetical protein
MRKKLFAVLSLVVLMSLLVPSAFAAEPMEPSIGTEVYWAGWWMLGEVFIDYVPAFDPVTGDSVFGPWLLNWPIDVWLYRPDTNPFFDPIFDAEWAALPGPWWVKAEEESALRRQSWPAYQTSDMFGGYYFKFMLPRDEVWYPCGYPCRWKCNTYVGAPLGMWTDFHSPYVLWFSYPDFWTMDHMPLFWPWDLDWWAPGLGWINPYGPPPFFEYYDYPIWMDATPFDTVHPLEMWIAEAIDGKVMYIYELGILGYQWKTSDPEMGGYYANWPELCGDVYEWPVY